MYLDGLSKGKNKKVLNEEDRVKGTLLYIIGLTLSRVKRNTIETCTQVYSWYLLQAIYAH